ncbi:MAG: nitroreductase [Deferribacteres bacterium]|nr:nitroreductase [Deferribacteres bacterium]
MDFFEVIKTRRSVRRFKEDPVPDELIEKILEAVKWAPSWSNTQCWEIIVVKDPELKKKIQEAIPEINPAYKGVGQAPVLLVGAAKRGVSGYYQGEMSTDKGDWYMFDMGIALEHAALAAHALGLGTVHIGLFDHKKVAELLDIPEGYEVVEILPIGYPARASKAPKRREISEFTHLNKFGNPWRKEE